MEKREAKAWVCCVATARRRVWLAKCAWKGGGLCYYFCSNIEAGNFVLLPPLLRGSSDAVLRGRVNGCAGPGGLENCSFLGVMFIICSPWIPGCSLGAPRLAILKQAVTACGLAMIRCTSRMFHTCRVQRPTVPRPRPTRAMVHGSLEVEMIGRRCGHARSAAPVIWDELGRGRGLRLHSGPLFVNGSLHPL